MSARTSRPRPSWLRGARPGGQPGAPFTGEQTPTGFAATQRRRQGTGRPLNATLVVLEATGNHRVALAVVRHEAGDRVARVNPCQPHHFAKTDALDARDLTLRAATLRSTP